MQCRAVPAGPGKPDGRYLLASFSKHVPSAVNRNLAMVVWESCEWELRSRGKVIRGSGGRAAGHEDGGGSRRSGGAFRPWVWPGRWAEQCQAGRLPLITGGGRRALRLRGGDCRSGQSPRGISAVAPFCFDGQAEPAATAPARIAKQGQRGLARAATRRNPQVWQLALTVGEAPRRGARTCGRPNGLA